RPEMGHPFSFRDINDTSHRTIAKKPKMTVDGTRRLWSFLCSMLSTESVDKSGDNLKRKAQSTGKMVA
ncbi:MAG: hypothetical protein WD600_15315, partial [Pseudohongiella sp.]